MERRGRVGGVGCGGGGGVLVTSETDVCALLNTSDVHELSQCVRRDCMIVSAAIYTMHVVECWTGSVRQLTSCRWLMLM